MADRIKRVHHMRENFRRFSTMSIVPLKVHHLMQQYNLKHDDKIEHIIKVVGDFVRRQSIELPRPSELGELMKDVSIVERENTKRKTFNAARDSIPRISIHKVETLQ